MKEKLSKAWNGYWFKEMDQEKENYGLFRILFYFTVMSIVFISYKKHTLYADETYYEPVFFFKIFNPIHHLPVSYTVAEMSFYLFSIMAMIGLFTVWTTKLAFLSAFYFFAPFQNYGSYQHLGSTIILSMLVLAISSPGDAYSMDNYLRKRLYPDASAKLHSPGEYVWPLAMLNALWCFIFFTAGLLKLITSGSDWLRYNMLGIFLDRLDFLYDFNMPYALSVWIRQIITENYWLGRMATISAVIIELAMPLIFVSVRLKKIMIGLSVFFLIMVMIVMGHHFYYTLLPYLFGIMFYEYNFSRRLDTFLLKFKRGHVEA